MSIGEQFDALCRGIVLVGTPINLFWMGIFAGLFTMAKAHLNHYDITRARKNSISSMVVASGLYVIAFGVMKPTPNDMLFWGTIALFFLLLMLSIFANFAAAIILKLYRHPITAFKLRYARLLRATADHLEDTTVERDVTHHEQRALNTIKEVMEEHADSVRLFLL